MSNQRIHKKQGAENRSWRGAFWARYFLTHPILVRFLQETTFVATEKRHFFHRLSKTHAVDLRTRS
jgi:hypothetical protein